MSRLTGIWTEQVIPRVINRALSTAQVQDMRRRVCAGLHDEVVEIGFGSGLNIPHYPGSVTRVFAVEPSPVATRLAHKQIAQTDIPIEHAGLDGQRLSLPSEGADNALSTFTLCTVPDAGAALSELHRVLKPGGAFHFLEHGRSPDAKVAAVQDRLEPVVRRIAAGCHINRDIARLIAQAGFVIENLSTYYAAAPKFFGYVFEGVARKPT